jgi:hypothetical protein
MIDVLEKEEYQLTELSKADEQSVNGSIGSGIVFWNTSALLCLN